MFERKHLLLVAVVLALLTACDAFVEIEDPLARSTTDPGVVSSSSGDGSVVQDSVSGSPPSTGAHASTSSRLPPEDSAATNSGAGSDPPSSAHEPPGTAPVPTGAATDPPPSSREPATSVPESASSTPGSSSHETGPGSAVTGSHGQETVEVAHAREVRGVWIATAWGINYPSRSGLSPGQLRDELATLVDVVAAAGLNAIYFQVRPEGDAFYRSAHEPWSRFLTGTQGSDPGLDPLAELIALAHPRGIEVHAWLNPYRARVSAGTVLHPDHMAARYPQFAYAYGRYTWMDPAAAPVRERLLAVVEDLVEGYAIDGIHLDDYFYPYPIAGTPFPDDATYAAYLAGGGTLGLADWRRENVNRMIGDVSALVRRLDPDTQFGVSPFGIYRPEHPPGIRGLDAYAALYADPLRWLAEGWLDYIAPQLYWPTTRTAQAFEPLLRWWGQNTSSAHLLVGHYLSKLGEEPEWTVAEFREQLRLVRETASASASGSIWYQIGPLLENRSGMAEIFRDEFYPEPALGPALLRAAGPAVPPPAVEPQGEGMHRVVHRSDAPVRAATVYREDENGEWRLVDIVDPAQSSFAFGSGRWAVATVLRNGLESRGVVIDLAADD